MEYKNCSNVRQKIIRTSYFVSYFLLNYFKYLVNRLIIRDLRKINNQKMKPVGFKAKTYSPDY